MVVDKSRDGVLKGLEVALWMQRRSGLYFKLLLGDKDTFRLSFRRLGQPFHLILPHLAAVGEVENGKFKVNL